MKFKHIIIISMILLAFTAAPASADKIIPTSTKVFFEKDGVPYNEPVKYTVHCYGYMIDATDPIYKNYWKGTYERKEPGTYNTTEVFSYSATVPGYGAKIYEPFYLNYRVIDYCTLEGETNGVKFAIENVSKSPLPDCNMRTRYVRTPSKYSDACYFETNQSNRCFDEQQNNELCNRYLEKFDQDKIYLKNVGTIIIDGKKMVRTEEYIECQEKARSLDFINCSRYFEEVPCEDYCDLDGNPIMRDCSLYFTIPTNENGDIISPKPELKQENHQTANQPTLKETLSAENDSLFTELYKFLKVIEAWNTVS